MKKDAYLRSTEWFGKDNKMDYKSAGKTWNWRGN